MPENINIQCVSDCSGIARETARRKVNELIALGWAARDADGFLHATSQGQRALKPLAGISNKYVERMFALFASIGANGHEVVVD